jgi:hypothetical protein
VREFLIFDISNYVQGTGSLIISLICLKWYRDKPNYIKVLGFYGLNSVVFTLFQEISALFFENQHIDTLAHAYVLLECILLSFLYYLIISNKRFRKVIVFSVLLYCTIYIFSFLFFSKSAHSIIRSVRDLQMIIFSMAYFFYLLHELSEDNLMRFPMFWINSATLVFFSGTFILSYFREYIIAMIGDGIADYWTFRNFFRFAFCLVLAYAGWLNLQSIRAQKSG